MASGRDSSLHDHRCQLAWRRIVRDASVDDIAETPARPYAFFDSFHAHNWNIAAFAAAGSSVVVVADHSY